MHVRTMTAIDDQPPAPDSDIEFELQLIVPAVQDAVDRRAPPRTGLPSHLAMEPFAATSGDAEGAALMKDADKRSLPRTDDPSRGRAGESSRTWFRTSRIFNENGAWYIATREGINVGPYHDLRRAQIDAGRLISMLEDYAKFGSQAQELTIRQFLDRPSSTRKS